MSSRQPEDLFPQGKAPLAVFASAMGDGKAFLAAI
jgi:hypothetical protein